MKKKIPVGVLAATGSVGQRFIQLLDNHPWFEVVALSASERSQGRKYGEACHWILPESMPEWAKEIEVVPNSPEFVNLPIVFSALPSNIAKEVEPEFAKSGCFVCSNASAYRQDPYVPILLPEINADQINIINIQREKYNWSGGIATNSNCTSTGMTIALRPLLNNFGIKKLFVVSLQAISGAGYPGVSGMDILGNVIPYIKGEDEKVEQEPLKMLGSYKNNKIEFADFKISAHTNRVPVIDGHNVCVSVELEKQVKIQDIKEAFINYKAPASSSELPSTPKPIINFIDKHDRPQPRIDRNIGKGMTTTVGHLREDPIFDFKFVVLSHNTIRGAAGGSIYNAELLYNEGYINI